jgi:predicted transcriptional regulator
MNVSFFLLPKVGVVWVQVGSTVRDAFQRMEETGYTAIPVLDDQGSYTGTITEGDLLRHLMHSAPGASTITADRVLVADVPLRARITPVDIDADVEQLFDRAIGQNFVPVQDSRGVFIGIVTRRKILEYCAGMFKNSPST